MTRTSLEDFSCSWARTSEIIADKWCVLILRDMFAGVSAFSVFKKRLGIAGNVLSDRLAHLIKHEVVEKRQKNPDVERYEYRLTKRGEELFPIFIAMGQWGDKWVFGARGEPVRTLDRKTGAPIQPVIVQSRDGRYLGPQDVKFAAGPGLDIANTLPGGRARR